jgi:CRISP-associated protein Cas1
VELFIYYRILEYTVADYPWVSVGGYGAHIKTTQKSLIIQKKNDLEEYPLDQVKNFLIVGGHTISSAAILKLVKNGIYVSFFEADGTPVGTIRPFSDQYASGMDEIQKSIHRQRFAIALARGSIKSRLSAIGRIEEKKNIRLFYEGEMDLLCKSEEELGFLIKLDEIRRLHRLTSDMYYEIMSRNLPAEFGFKRRTIKPQMDPINAMLSFGYAMLFGNCNVSIVGSRLNPDLGVIQDGRGSLVHDLIDPLKAEMIDPIVFSLASESLTSTDFETTLDRCILSDELIKNLVRVFQISISNERINEQVLNFCGSIRNNEEFKVLY